jgi:DNA/RNA-binding domain of Phe-tRNA-synthetase-like protein
MWFILESLPAMPLESLQQAGEDFATMVEQLLTNARVEIKLLQPGQLVNC